MTFTNLSFRRATGYICTMCGAFEESDSDHPPVVCQDCCEDFDECPHMWSKGEDCFDSNAIVCTLCGCKGEES